MRFLVDAQLPPTLARFLSDNGYEAEHVIDLGLENADDSRVWNYAVETGASIITKDEDFSSKIILDPQGPTIVWVRIGNCTNRHLIEWFHPLLPNILKRLDQGEKLIEIV